MRKYNDWAKKRLIKKKKKGSFTRIVMANLNKNFINKSENYAFAPNGRTWAETLNLKGTNWNHGYVIMLLLLLSWKQNKPKKGRIGNLGIIYIYTKTWET